MRKFFMVLAVASIGLAIIALLASTNQDTLIGYVPNASTGTISAINTQENKIINTFKVGDSASHGIGVTPDGKKIYTGNLHNGDILVYDTEDERLIKTISTGRNLHGIDISPNGKYVFTTSGWTDEKEEYNYIDIVDTSKDEIVKTILSDSKSPAHIDFSEDSKRAFIINVMSNNVSIVDVENGEIMATIDVGTMPNEAELSPDGKFLYVANVQEGSISVVDIEKKQEINKIKAGEGTHGVAVSDDGDYVWTTNQFSNDVSVIDINKEQVITTIKTNGKANHISILPNKKLAYVSNMESENIDVIDMDTYEIIKTISVDGEPHEIEFIQFK